MYTQCPDCATAFRVTADILKQAGGKVRCGGCGIAFNALAFLSETKPVAPPPPDTDDALPELTPDPVEESAVSPPSRAISPEQSAALLQTLDELAGSDIRLEDTGVEWRLLDSDEDDDDADDAVQLPDDIDTPIDAELSGDTGNTAIDEILDDTPADLDEFLTDTPSEVEASEVFETADGEVEAGDIFETADGEIEAGDIFETADGEVEASEVFETADGEVESAEIFDDDSGTHDTDEELDSIDDQVEPADNDDELRFDDNTGLPDDDGDVAESATVVAFEDHVEPEPEPEFIEPAEHAETQVDIVFGEPDEWGELLDEVDVVPGSDEAPVAVPDDIIEPELDEDDSEPTSLAIEDELDAEPLEESAIPESTGELESELARAQDLSDKIRTALSRHGVEEIDDLDDDDDSSEEYDGLSLELDDAEEDVEDLPELEVAAADNADDDFELGGDFDAPAGETTPVIDVPGFPSFDSGVETIIMEGEFVRTALEQEALDAEAARKQEPEEISFIAAAKQTFRGKMSRFDNDDDTPPPKRNARIAAGLALLSLLLGGQLVHQSRAELATIPAVSNVIAPIYRMIGAPITPRWDVTGWKFEVTRETLRGAALATATPEPEVIDAAAEEETSAADAAADVEIAQAPEILTIYSRLGNSAEHPLPYPLITVSLTDRYEETIGSTILEPSDYLPPAADTSRMIAPGNTFEAVIPIESPSGDATGYKLNVCYRQAGNALRCAVADFK